MSLTALLGCNSGQASAPDPGPTLIEVRDGQTVLVTVRPGKPCRATIGPNEMIVGSDPLVSQLGESRWTGESTPSGIVIHRDGAMVARLYPVGEPNSAGVYDANGVALARIARVGDKATVTDAASRVIHTIALQAGTIVVQDGPDAPATTPVVAKTKITGTTDLVLAALVGAAEIGPELRMLAACERVTKKQVP
jgi:hypothetical protein